MAPLYTQPVDVNGKLLLSAWLDPDGSDFDEYVWDDFTLPSTESITDIAWYGVYDPLRQGKGGPVTDFRVRIYPSITANTEPAIANPPLLDYQTGGNAGETIIGTIAGAPLYAYASSLPTPFAAAAGVRYWIQIEASQQGLLPDWSFAAGAGGDQNHYWRGPGAGGDIQYRARPGDAAFTLLGPIPAVPTGIFLSNTSLAENQPANTVIGELAATHTDPNATFLFSLTCTAAGMDDASFNIQGSSLQTSAVFDLEAKSTYNLCIRVTDQTGLSLDENFVVTVTNVNEAPADISLSASAVAENQPINTVVGVLTAGDPDIGPTFTFSLACAVAGADDASFNISGANLQTSAVFDFETKSSYNICIRVADEGGLTFDENFIVTVNDLTENTPPTDISLSNNTVGENLPLNTVVGALAATDPDAGATFTFSLACTTAGADDISFNVSGASLQTSAPFDFETKSTYNICIRVSDQGGLTFDKNFAITVSNVNEAPTGVSISNTMVDENRPVNTLVGALSATDPDAGAAFTFNLTCAVAGTDDVSFNILGVDLRTSALFDFEMKSAYNICIRVTDQDGLTFDKNFVIFVNNVNEAPTALSLSANAVAESQPVNTVVGTLNATDPDAGSTFTFSLTCAVARADDTSFNILGTDLRTSAIFDFETKPTYDICIRVTDQDGLSFDKNFVITVNDVIENTAPTDVTLSNNTVNENQPVNTVVGTLTATDPDAVETFAFSLTCAAPGLDEATFNIQGAILQTSAMFDFETKSTYSICIRVTDQGGLTFDKNFVITVNDLVENAAPTDIALSRTSIAENQPINTVVGTLTATDPDAGETFTFSLVCAGANNGSFNILGTDLRTSATFDFETKPTYDICIRVTDQGGLSFEENFVVAVKDVYETTNTPGKVTGGGNIGSDQGKDKITFSLNISYRKGDAQPQGSLTYQDHKADVRLKAKAFEILVIHGSHVWITGLGILNDGQLVPFTLEMDASGKLGQSGTFYIRIPALNGYEAGGALTGGKITIH